MWLVRSCLWCLNECALWCARLAVLAALTLGAVLWAAHRAPVALPDMAVDGLVAVLDRRAAPAGLTLTLQGAEVALRDGLVPGLLLRGLVLRRVDGTEVMRLDTAEAVFSRNAAIRGHAIPLAMTARGATVTLERNATGAISLRLGNATHKEQTPSKKDALFSLLAFRLAGASAD